MTIGVIHYLNHGNGNANYLWVTKTHLTVTPTAEELLCYYYY